MGKRSQALGRWPRRPRSPHTFVMWFTDLLGKRWSVPVSALTRPDQEKFQQDITAAFKKGAPRA